jgi:peptidoglycan hydrolase FlgJ
MALPSKLTDRLLAGIVPGGRGGGRRDQYGCVPDCAPAPPMDGVLNGAVAQPMPCRRFAGPDAGVRPRRGPATAGARRKKPLSSPDAFVATMLPMAKQAAERIGVDPLLPGGAGGPGNRLGQIGHAPARRQQQPQPVWHQGHRQSWQGAQARAITSEFRKGGQMVKETAAVPFLRLVPGQLPRPRDVVAEQ